MIQLKGIAWDHPRGFDPMVATANLFQKKNPEIEIQWDKRPLQAFADRPIEEMAFGASPTKLNDPNSGFAPKPTCRVCNAPNSVGERFCMNCGSEL